MNEEQETRRENRLILIILGVVVAGLLVLALYGYLSGRWEPRSGAAAGEARCEPDAQRAEYVRRILVGAADEALEAHIGKLFGTWMADLTNQPQRAARGARLALIAYNAMQRNVAAATVEELTCPKP